MSTGLVYLFTSITLAVLLPYLRSGSGHEQVGNRTCYRYPKNFCKFFLYAIPVIATLLVLPPFTVPPNERTSFGGIFYALVAVCSVGLIAIAYIFFDSYRVHLDDSALAVTTIFGDKAISLRASAQVATVEGKGTDLYLYDGGGKLLLHLDGSIQDFGYLLLEIEQRTRSQGVLLFRANDLEGWQQKPNIEHAFWQPSKGPHSAPNYKRSLAIVLVGLALILATLLATRIWLN